MVDLKTLTDFPSTRNYGCFATQDETAPVRRNVPHDLVLTVDDPAASYEDPELARLPASVKVKGRYTLPIARGCSPVLVAERPADSHPVVIPVWPLCFRYPDDRKDDLNYSPLEPGTWIYIYVDGHLWDELYTVQTDGATVQFARVNLTLHQGRDQRLPTTALEPMLMVPYTTKDKKIRRIEIGISHVQWSWAQMMAYGGLDSTDPRHIADRHQVAPFPNRPPPQQTPSFN